MLLVYKKEKRKRERQSIAGVKKIIECPNDICIAAFLLITFLITVKNFVLKIGNTSVSDGISDDMLVWLNNLT